jgi:hypothetical protein
MPETGVQVVFGSDFCHITNHTFLQFSSLSPSKHWYNTFNTPKPPPSKLLPSKMIIQFIQQHITSVLQSVTKLAVIQSAKKLPLFHATLNVSLLCSQKPATGPYPESDDIITPNLFKIHFNTTLAYCL